MCGCPRLLLPSQVVTLEALLQQNNDAPDKRGGGGEAQGGASGGKGAQGLTYVMASGGRLWSTALRMESQRAEGAAERTVRWVRRLCACACTCVCECVRLHPSGCVRGVEWLAAGGAASGTTEQQRQVDCLPGRASLRATHLPHTPCPPSPTRLPTCLPTCPPFPSRIAARLQPGRQPS